MTIAINSALAVAFPWVSNGTGADLAVIIGVTTYTGTVASGTYRVLLGTGATAGGSTEPLADFLQVVEAALNAAILASGETIAVTLGADGRVTLTGSAPFDFALLPAGTESPLTVLGFNASGSSAATYTAAHAPKHLALMISRTSTGRAVRTASLWATDAAGRTYGVTSGVITRREEHTVDFIPRTPTVATAHSTPATACGPDTGTDLDALGAHVVPWTWDDVLATAGGRVCGFTPWDFPALIASTSGTRFDLVTIDPAALADHTYEPVNPRWAVYYRLTLPLTGLATLATAARS